MKGGGTNGDEAGQIVAFRPQSITDPCPHAGPKKRLVTAVNLHAGSAVCDICFTDGIDNAQFIRDSRKMLPQLGHPLPGGAHLPEASGRFHDIGPIRELNLALLERKRLVVLLVQAGLVVKQIHV